MSKRLVLIFSGGIYIPPEILSREDPTLPDDLRKTYSRHLLAIAATPRLSRRHLKERLRAGSRRAPA